jgi:chanoclavine-I dehydrogenase
VLIEGFISFSTLHNSCNMAALLASKVFAVTGGSSGIGLATCKCLAEKGAAGIHIGDFNDNAFASVVNELGKINSSTKVVTTKLDVSSSTDVESWVKKTVETFGRLDGAANVAGRPQKVADTELQILGESRENWKRIMEVNLDGVFFCTQSEVRAMMSLSAAPRSIVNVASLASYLHPPQAYAYGASKAAVAFFSRSVAKETVWKGIRVNAVSPSKSIVRKHPIAGSVLSSILY